MNKYVGQNIKRYDAMGHVTAGTIYVDDIKLPGMLYIKALRSPVSRGIIKKLDLSPALNTLGVAGAMSAKELGHDNAMAAMGHPVFAINDVKYKGQVIAAVAAYDEDTAQEAINKIILEIEELPPVLDPFEAMKADAPKVREEGNLHIFDGVCPYRRIRFGDVEKGFEQADYIIENSFYNPMSEGAQIETQCSVATIDNSGSLTIHTVSQAPYFHLPMLSAIFNLPMNKIRMIGGTVGGGFGGKNDIHADHITGLMALRLRKPVKWRWTREEEMLYSTFRGAWYFDFKDGVTKDGRIVARKIRTVHDTGAYSIFGPYVVDKNSILVAGPFTIPNIWVDGYCVFTNKPGASSLRGFGIINGTFAEQVQMDRIAEKVGMDPWEIRFINAWREGDLGASSQKMKAVSLIETMQACAKLANIKLPDKLLAMSSKQGV